MHYTITLGRTTKGILSDSLNRSQSHCGMNFQLTKRQDYPDLLLHQTPHHPASEAAKASVAAILISADMWFQY